MFQFVLECRQGFGNVASGGGGGTGHFGGQGLVILVLQVAHDDGFALPIWQVGDGAADQGQ